MKRLLRFLLLVLPILFYGCTDSSNNVILVNPDVITFTHEGGSEYVTVEGVDWDVTTSATWVTAKKEGNTVKVTVGASGETRVANVIVSNKDDDKTIIVTQSGIDFTITPSLTALKFSADGQSATDQAGASVIPVFTVSSSYEGWNGVWDVNVTPVGSWCSVSKSGNTFTVSATANTLPTSPTPATVTVTSGNMVSTIAVTQQFTPTGKGIYNAADYVQFAADLLVLSSAEVKEKWAHTDGMINIWDDIDLSGVKYVTLHDTEMAFTHWLNGNFRTLSNVTKNPIFHTLASNGLVRDLKVAVDMDNNVGGAIAMVNSGRIYGCTVTGNLTHGSGAAGGIAWVNRSGGTIAGCTADVNVSGKGSAGGIVGVNEGSIYACCVTGGKVTAIPTDNPKNSDGAGGIVGENRGSLKGCYSMATAVDVMGPNGGGVIGYASEQSDAGYLFWVHEPTAYNTPAYAIGSDNNWGGAEVVAGYAESADFTGTGKFQYHYLGGIYPDPATTTLAAMLNAGLAATAKYEFTPADGTNPPDIKEK